MSRISLLFVLMTGCIIGGENNNISIQATWHGGTYTADGKRDDKSARQEDAQEASTTYGIRAGDEKPVGASGTTPCTLAAQNSADQQNPSQQVQVDSSLEESTPQHGIRVGDSAILSIPDKWEHATSTDGGRCLVEDRGTITVLTVKRENLIVSYGDTGAYYGRKCRIGETLDFPVDLFIKMQKVEKERRARIEAERAKIDDMVANKSNHGREWGAGTEQWVDVVGGPSGYGAQCWVGMPYLAHANSGGTVLDLGEFGDGRVLYKFKRGDWVRDHLCPTGTLFLGKPK